MTDVTSKSKGKKGMKLFTYVPPHIYDIFVQVARLRGSSISDTVRSFFFMHYDLLQEFLKNEKAKFSKKKKEVSNEKKLKTEVTDNSE